MRALLLAFTITATAHAQWDIQNSGTTASLRGIASVGKGVAWASGTNGTVLRTEDGGYLWQHCVTPPGAETLDFRGIQAFDANTAIVMSSGKGDLSRLYKTTDGCQTWTLVFTNPDIDGFFDSISMSYPRYMGRYQQHVEEAEGYVLGDPVGGNFSIFVTRDNGKTWNRRIAAKRGPKGEGCSVDAFSAKDGESSFAASNESLFNFSGGYFVFVTGGTHARVGYNDSFSLDGALCHESAHYVNLPIAHGVDSSGAFALAILPLDGKAQNFPDRIVIVGGNYQSPDAAAHNAVTISHFGYAWRSASAATTPPHGYRSAVAYDAATKTWITVGPNGTDISTDDGRNWRALTPGPGEPADADKNWNALSLPFVVGPKGRIGVLRPEALKPHP